MEEYLIPPINGLKKRNLRYKEIEWLIKRITDAEHKVPDETRLKKAIEKAGRMFTVLSVMALVKGGTFQMGKGPGELDEGFRPVHTVNLTYEYWIGKYHVTFNEYKTYCEDTGKGDLPIYRDYEDYDLGNGNKPVIEVTWHEAIAYCNWLSEKEGLFKAYDSKGNLLDKKGKPTTDITQVEGYRLPTEAEWKYVEMGGHKSTSDYKDTSNNSIDAVAWYDDNSNSKTQKEGQNASNKLGVYYMNVRKVLEWCHDWYGSYSGNTQINPIGPNSASERVLNGGSWHIKATNYSVFDFRTSISFRLARTREGV